MNYLQKKGLQSVYLTEFESVYNFAKEIIAGYLPRCSETTRRGLILGALDSAVRDALLIDSVSHQREFLLRFPTDLQRDLEDLLLANVIDLLYPLRTDGVLLVTFYDLLDSGTLAVCWDHETCEQFHTRIGRPVC